MGTVHKHGYLYSLSQAFKLARTCAEMKDALKQRKPEALESFDRDYWHAMRHFAYAESGLVPKELVLD